MATEKQKQFKNTILSIADTIKTTLWSMICIFLGISIGAYHPDGFSAILAMGDQTIQGITIGLFFIVMAIEVILALHERNEKKAQAKLAAEQS